MLLKDRDIIIEIYDTDTNEVINKLKLFIKSIAYDVKPSGASFSGLKKADTLQWYSSLINFTIRGDSYVNPFLILSPMLNFDENIKKLYKFYVDKFFESQDFEIGRYKIRFKILNCPIGVDYFEGVITSFSFSESDSQIGMIDYELSFLGKPITLVYKDEGIEGFLKDLLGIKQ